MINRHADRCECLCLCPSVCLSIYLLGERRVVGLLRVVVCRREGAFLFVCVCGGGGRERFYREKQLSTRPECKWVMLKMRMERVFEERGQCLVCICTIHIPSGDITGSAVEEYNEGKTHTRHGFWPCQFLEGSAPRIIIEKRGIWNKFKPIHPSLSLSLSLSLYKLCRTGLSAVMLLLGL